MARTYNTLFLAVLVLFNTHDMQVSAQMGTVQNALFDYIRMNSQQQPQPATNTQQQPATAAPPPTNLGTGGTDLFNSFTQNSQPATNTNTNTNTNSQLGSSTGGSFMDMFASSLGSTGTQQQTAPTNTGAVQTPTSTITKQNNPMDFYNQLMQVVNPATSQSQPQPQPQPITQTLTNPQPGMDPFTNNLQPATGQTNQVQPQPQPQQPPKLLPFVPPEWNLPPAQTSQANPWGASQTHGTTGWGHQSHHQGPTAWEQYRHPNHTPTPQPTPLGQGMGPGHPAPHPMGQMMMIPRVRDMINKQATQFGDLAYYQQHGCVDPTPTVPGPGGIRPTQTLWLGCQSPVSKMVCTRVGRTAGGPSGAMSMMMAMMNPQMMRTFEKCLSPKMLTKMMFQGMSGGMGGMNPAMMMLMGGGGGGGMAMMPMIMSMMNQQNQAAGGMNGGMGGMGGGMNGGMGGGMNGGMTGGLGGGMTGGGMTGGGMTGGLNPTSSPATGANSVPTSSGGSKLSYKDPSSANTLISQAARIPTPAGAAQPQQPASTNPFSGMLGGLFGMGGGANPASQATTSLPFGAANTVGGGAFGAQQQAGEVDCSSVMPLVMSRVMAAGEGIASPEAQEAIGELRKQYLPYSCQELRLTYTGLPLRLCCPGRVDPPTMMDLFKAKSAGGA